MRTLSCVVLSVVLALATVTAAPSTEVRLRPQDARLEQVLKEGAARSATFKALVDRIEASNVIVYVALNPMMKSSLAGMLTWMTRAGDFRYVRASISTELPFDQMIATVAHELQHAVEVIEDENVIDEKSLIALYQRIGLRHSAQAPARWETTAAQQTGFQVRRELIQTPASTVVARATISRS
jgi:hypothetical protein